MDGRATCFLAGFFRGDHVERTKRTTANGADCGIVIQTCPNVVGVASQRMRMSLRLALRESGALSINNIFINTAS
jgi:hypothetical protein